MNSNSILNQSWKEVKAKMRAVVNSEKKKRINDMSRPSKLWFDSWDKVLRIRTSKGVAKAHAAFMKKHKEETKGVWSVNKAAMDNPYCMALAFCLSEIVKAAERAEDL